MAAPAVASPTTLPGLFAKQIKANLKKTAKGDRGTLISAAESAISAGPR